MSTEEQKARELLKWAVLACLVSVTVTLIDFMLKREILEAVNRGREAAQQAAQPAVHPADDLVHPAQAPAAGAADEGYDQRPETD